MDGILLGNCLSFSCLAGDCPSSCCIGWQISVDETSYKRFTEISDSNLREDIISNIIKGKDGYYFSNRKDGSCKMLDSDGLCRIQRMTTEGMLCETCRKYPRLIGRMENGKTIISMAASCPVIAEGICEDEIVFYSYGKEGRFYKINYNELNGICTDEFKGLYEFIDENKRDRHISKEAHPAWFILYKAMLVIVDKCVDLMLNFHGKLYLEECFSYFESEVPLRQVMSDLSEYHREIHNVWLGNVSDGKIDMETYDNINKMWKGMAKKYWEYRQFTRYLEFMHEAKDERNVQVAGELLLIYIVGFSRYMAGKGVTPRIWHEQVAWCYRFCAHGFKMSKQLHEFFVKFSEEVINGLSVIISDNLI